VPAILEKAGMLERFYTDICADVGLGRWLVAGRHLPGIGNKLQRLAARRLPPEIRPKTRTFTLPMLNHGLKLILAGRNAADRYREHLRWSCEMGQSIAQAGFGGATHLFTMLGEGGCALAQAKSRGLHVVSEVYILLSTERILARERQLFPGWDQEQAGFEAIRQQFPEANLLLTHTDFAVCPSPAVHDDLVHHFGLPHHHAIVVPYGMNPKILDLPLRPQPRRVLYVGTAELRKGIHYLAMAAEKLAAKKIGYEFRIAGNVSPTIAEKVECRHLTFLGRVPRERITEEYQQADVLVLPSLAEGSAEVTYEALAAALPIITTHAAGSVARDGIEGRIVPERDPEALADAIEEVVENRALRARMAAAARERARDYTWERYGERLLLGMNSLLTPPQVKAAA